ncbi:MAG: ATP-dependent zinc metalloprotease FtsH [Bacteroidota bacterium]
MKKDKNPDPGKGNTSPFRFFRWILLLVLGYFLLTLIFPQNRATRITYDRFRDSLEMGRVASVTLSRTTIEGEFRAADTARGAASSQDTVAPVRRYLPFARVEEGPDLRFQVTRVENDEKLIPLLEEHNVTYRARKESGLLGNLLIWLIPLFLLILFWRMMFRGMRSGMGKDSGAGGGPGNILNIGQNKAKQYIKDEKNDVTFKDVAGVDEAKEELSEMIQFLRDPEQFTRLGGKLPKGVILIGPPGTGKTLLARAVAGEAHVPFFSLTGSEFVEMFVGVGAARVRDLFKQAKSKAPCIVFIDEIDAIGKSRGQAIQVSSNDERENTLNQLLSEMDGFEPGDKVIVMASTNRPEVLDRALLRPGRFDRQVLLDRPDLNGRVDILKVHTKDLKLHPDIDLKNIAAQTPGFSGADLANISNEAALLASRKNKKNVEETDFQEAIERVVAGLEKKSRLINPKEKKIVAYHESGHALVGHYTEGADPVHKVSIVPRGLGALGYTLQTPLEDRFLMTRSELEGKIKGMLGGRAAEEIIFGEISTGAANDLERVTHIATEMITIYGMSESLPNISLKKHDHQDLLGRDAMVNRRSEQTEQLVDDEVKKIISSCYDSVLQLLKENKKKLVHLAEELLEKEVLQEEDVKRILD